MEQALLGSSTLEVSRVGLGCNNFGRRLDLPATRAVIDAAIEAGVTFLDTADIYGSGESERFIGEALAGRGHEVVLATKFGNERRPDGGWIGINGRPEYVRVACDARYSERRPVRGLTRTSGCTAPFNFSSSAAENSKPSVCRE